VADIAVARSNQRKAAAEEADATQHQMAMDWLGRRMVGDWRPVYAAGTLYLPQPDGRWVPMTPGELEGSVADAFDGRKRCSKRADYLAIAGHLQALSEDNAFFDDAPPGVASPAGFHALGDDGQVATVDLALEHRQLFVLPFAPDFEAEAPLMDGLLAQAFAGAHQADQTELWWQAVGAILFGLMVRHQLVLLLYGRERSGKSLLQRVLERLFPVDAVAAVSPASWDHEYHVAALANKRINIVGELSADRPLPEAGFKNTTGQNLLTGRHPTHRPFTFRCNAAHVFASNVLPHTADRSDAFFRRWRVLRFANTVPADQVDPNLFEKIVGELPAILASACRGAETVAQRGAVRTTAEHDAVLQKWRAASNPIVQFLDDAEWVELDPAAQLHRTAEVYQAYRRWAAAAGFRNPLGRNHFLDLLEATGATRGVLVKRQNVVGLRLADRGD
jgi:putative DNA primase/helicase